MQLLHAAQDEQRLPEILLICFTVFPGTADMGDFASAGTLIRPLWGHLLPEGEGNKKKHAREGVYKRL